jgi:hypothetical protein
MRRAATAVIGALLTALAIGITPAAASAAAGGDNNAGDVWVDTVGAPQGRGHETDPHLPCADINLWGDKLADPTGSYRVIGIPPSGAHGQAYMSTWTYQRASGGNQVIDVIDVERLISAAVANGDRPVNRQGFHFKLALSQDPHKFKTFWVKCAVPGSTGGGGGDGTTTPPSTPPGSGSQPPLTPPGQGVLGERQGPPRSKPAHRRKAHHKKAHHRRRHHKVTRRQMMPAFTG